MKYFITQNLRRERKLTFMVDNTDNQILSLLLKNSRMQWKEIGDIVHMTGQAVAARVQKLEEMGIIEGYTVKLNAIKLGKNVTGFVTVFMKNHDHTSFMQFLINNEIVLEAHRISGDGCYWVKICTSSQEQVNTFLDQVLKFGNYRISLSIDKIK